MARMKEIATAAELAGLPLDVELDALLEALAGEVAL